MSDSVKTSVAIGKCPRCNSENVVYDKEFVDDDLLIFPGRCLDCECQFKERYFLDYLDTELQTQKTRKNLTQQKNKLNLIAKCRSNRETNNVIIGGQIP